MALPIKHRNAIANVLKEEISKANKYAYQSKKVEASKHRDERISAICEVSKELSRYFLRDNPKFSKVKFITLSGCDDVIKVGAL